MQIHKKFSDFLWTLASALQICFTYIFIYKLEQRTCKLLKQLHSLEIFFHNNLVMILIYCIYRCEWKGKVLFIKKKKKLLTPEILTQFGLSDIFLEITVSPFCLRWLKCVNIKIIVQCLKAIKDLLKKYFLANFLGLQAGS